MQLSMCKNGLWTEKPLTHPESRNASESGWNSRAALVELGVYTSPQNSPPSFSQYLLPGHPQGLSIKVAGCDFCCGVAGAGGMSILVGGAGWEVMLRARSVKL